MAKVTPWWDRLRSLADNALTGSPLPFEPRQRKPKRPDPREMVRLRARFVLHARALAYTRLAFLVLAAVVVLVPQLARAVGFAGIWPKLGLALMICYAVANLLLLRSTRHGVWVTLATLLLDQVAVAIVVGHSGGMHSPAMDAHLLLTVFFALLFPRPIAVLPPLLALPIGAVLGGGFVRNWSGETLLLLWYVALCAIAFYLIVYLTHRQESQQRAIVQLEQDLKNLAVLDERARLSREIHDGLGAALSGLIIQMEYLMTLTRDRQVRDELTELKDAAEEAIAELRRALRMMRDEFELVPSLQATCEAFRNRRKIPCQLELTGQPPRLTSEQQLTLFRILQEALNNASKHARPKRVTVKVQFFVDGLQLQVIDDGCGFDERNTPVHHYGLVNMRDRARKVGGDVMIESELGAGTAVTFVLRGVGGEATREAAIPVRYTAQAATRSSRAHPPAH
ncbi:MAG: sensor histidine kinase [Deltaproteobacteria bacterium]|nr:sensor histidine kinase [Deltaproteobacteria bacterium]